MYCGDKLLKFECKQGKIGMKRYLNDGILKILNIFVLNIRPKQSGIIV